MLDDGSGSNIFSARSLVTDQKTSQKYKRLESLSHALSYWMSVRKYSELKVKQKRHWGHKVGIHEKSCCNVNENAQNYCERIATAALEQRDNFQERNF